jgi:hypothetical protein
MFTGVFYISYFPTGFVCFRRNLLDICYYRNQTLGQEILLDSANTMMAMSAEAAASQIQERLKSLHHLVADIQSSREKSEHNLTSITKAQERMAHDTKVNASHQVCLKIIF